ncbi:MAG: response regulator [Polyangiaceae bacterium]|nr:response regulator [Polyangiaceae bacterium]
MTETLARIHVLLLADDGETGFGHLVALLEAQHYKVRRVTTLAGAMQYLGSVDVQAFIIDPSVQGVGVEGLREVREKFPAVALVALTDERGEYPGSRCAEAGAHDYSREGRSPIISCGECSLTRRVAWRKPMRSSCERPSAAIERCLPPRRRRG